MVGWSFAKAAVCQYSIGAPQVLTDPLPRRDQEILLTLPWPVFLVLLPCEEVDIKTRSLVSSEWTFYRILAASVRNVAI